ncbi:serine/threonine-protein kinase [Anatilimnocola floriformis]|uniref:serine/threonine-protein kinase n=1 Tax=Anatilimnocola floriformis TaxID=2948575 RepID=UPI0020C21C79|nr:serine/threonine-protein kinase [Anatilimnocola floriformis]
MNDPAISRCCPTCGMPIPEHAPAGLCPRCLLNAGLESGGATSPATPPGGFSPPEIAILAAKFPQLEILELLGKGGMGAVYKARQRGLDRLVAIKILPPEIGNDPAFAERFAREARALGKLNHPHIVAVYDFGQVDGLYYFLMEYVDGANLRQAIHSGGLTSKDALSIVSQVCDALQFAHDEGVVHRDIKPENILIDKRGRVKIADFGLAKLLGQDQADQNLTHTHQVMGTLRYMAPEQMQGSKEVDHRADIFSLGVVFYELLTGELPVGRFAPPSKTFGVDARLDEVVLRSLEREPTLRYQHVSEVKTQVQSIAGISPAALQRMVGREYRSQAEFFGWPLVHIASGIDAQTGKPKIAQGIIAIGDTAIGGLAIGGRAVGVFACGGVAVGLFSLGGVSLGLLFAFGGCAFGLLAFGGLAIGALAAGGCAVGYYAIGGGAFGLHTLSGASRDPAAMKLLENVSNVRTWPTWILWLGLAVPAGFGLLIGFVVWLQNRKAAPPVDRVIEEEKRLRAEQDRVHAQRMSLRDQESVWYDLGVIVAYFLRSKTVCWIIGALASLVYLGCLITYFNFHGQRLMQGGQLVQRFSAGQPTPWLTVEASATGYHAAFHFFCWAHAVALTGFAALQVARQMERLQTGKMHSMVWHYVLWIVVLFLVVVLGLSHLTIPIPVTH